jgi:predicted nucleic acid-binding Zn finger protein
MQSSKDLLSDLYLKIKDKDLEEKVLIEKLEQIYPDKSTDVLQVIQRGITKYTFKPSNRIIWTAIGENDEYLIYPKIYCSCIDFYNRVVLKRKKLVCKHLIAQTVCEALNSFENIIVEEKDFNEFMSQLKLE